MSYQIKLDAKSRKSARFISRLQKAIQQALAESGKTQQEVAEILGVDRSVVNRRLKGGANLTARSIAEFAYALDKDVVVTFKDIDSRAGANSTASPARVIEAGAGSRHPAYSHLMKDGQYRLESVAS